MDVPLIVGLTTLVRAAAPPPMVMLGVVIRGVVSMGVTVEADTLPIRWVSTTEPDDAANPNW